MSLMYICQSKKSTFIYLTKIMGPLNILHHTAQRSIAHRELQVSLYLLLLFVVSARHKGMINDQLYKVNLFHPALCSDFKFFHLLLWFTGSSRHQIPQESGKIAFIWWSVCGFKNVTTFIIYRMHLWPFVSVY